MADATQPNVRKEAEEATEAVKPPSRRRGIVIVVFAVLVIAALGFWWRSTFSEETDDAQINGHLIQVSSRVGGQIAKVYVDENQVVKAGDPIADIDTRDLQVAVENAQAALATAEANAAAAQVNVPITTVNTGTNLTAAGADVSGAQASVSQAEKQLESAKARVAQAVANNAKAQADLERYKPLVAKDVISKQQFDAAVAAATSAQASVADAQAAAASRRCRPTRVCRPPSSRPPPRRTARCAPAPDPSPSRNSCARRARRGSTASEQQPPATRPQGKERVELVPTSWAGSSVGKQGA